MTLAFLRTCYMYVITGGENTSSTVKLKLRGKLHCMQPIQGFGSWLWELPNIFACQDILDEVAPFPLLKKKPIQRACAVNSYGSYYCTILLISSIYFVFLMLMVMPKFAARSRVSICIFRGMFHLWKIHVYRQPFQREPDV